MVTKVTSYQWSDKVGGLVVVPLDDADAATIEMVRLLVGKPTPPQPSLGDDPNADR